MEERKDYKALADEIRQTATQNVPHSGSEHLPEDMRERPVVEFDNTPLEEAVGTHIDPENPPHDASSLVEAPVKPVHEGARSKKRRNALIGSAAAVSLIATVGVLGLMNRDSGSSKHEGNTEPTAGASQVPGQKSTEQGGSSAETPVSVTLDPSIDGSIQPLSGNQVNQIQNNQTWPNDIDKAVSASIDPADMNRFVYNGVFDDLLNQYPSWDELYTFYNKYYKFGGLVDTMTSNSVLASIYNNSIAATSQLYGQPQEFKGAGTADMIGKAPYVTMSEIHQAAQTQDFLSLYNKLAPIDRGADLLNAYINEVKAGNTDPNLANHIAEEAYIGKPTASRDDLVNTLTKFQADYQTDPKSALAEFNSYPTTRDEVMVLGVTRLATGANSTLTDDTFSPDNTALTAGFVYEKDTVTDQNGQKTSVVTVSLVAFPKAPVADGQEKAVQMVVIDSISNVE